MQPEEKKKKKTNIIRKCKGSRVKRPKPNTEEFFFLYRNNLLAVIDNCWVRIVHFFYKEKPSNMFIFLLSNGKIKHIKNKGEIK